MTDIIKTGITAAAGFVAGTLGGIILRGRKVKELNEKVEFLESGLIELKAENVCIPKLQEEVSELKKQITLPATEAAKEETLPS